MLGTFAHILFSPHPSLLKLDSSRSKSIEVGLLDFPNRNVSYPLYQFHFKHLICKDIYKLWQYFTDFASRLKILFLFNKICQLDVEINPVKKEKKMSVILNLKINLIIFKSQSQYCIIFYFFAPYLPNTPHTPQKSNSGDIFSIRKHWSNAWNYQFVKNFKVRFFHGIIDVDFFVRLRNFQQ